MAFRYYSPNCWLAAGWIWCSLHRHGASFAPCLPWETSRQPVNKLLTYVAGSAVPQGTEGEEGGKAGSTEQSVNRKRLRLRRRERRKHEPRLLPLPMRRNLLFASLLSFKSPTFFAFAQLFICMVYMSFA